MDDLGAAGRGGEYSRRGNLQKYENPNPRQRGLIRYFHRRVAKVVEASRPGGILDVGCGEGFTIDRLLRVNGHLPLQGLDPAALREREL